MLITTFKTDRTVTQSASFFRGFVAGRFPESVLLHQHDGQNLIYAHPLVQYKLLDDLMIVGMCDGAEALHNIYNRIDRIVLGGEMYNVTEKSMHEKTVDFSHSPSFVSYTFLTPWLALNENNYKKYQRLGTWQKRKELLSKILIGNILSMSKSLGYTVPAPIEVELGKLREVPTKLKGTPMIGFLGSFSVNFEIPDLWGIGKSVSRGFGTVKRIRKAEKQE